ncbi:MAG: branched-chain amino acid ABC transporter permease [Christensenellales bacterium]|uniref:Branched-chain amino acid ABC transporter permease n=1 Tax=Candidatus Avichristensenella intestinipullorum TaxID=2840693 RepID=A0A9D1CIX2_9FIRM|nr:branched-chain amino acid ABC transporter permease [Christensenellales bacterium]HIQ63576.1 branched-chain amino acid ABC transporter permease [Candidatus Avichristensenella intestinipullorum]
MSNFLNQLINGLHVGSIYALIALGYTMVYGIVRLINFAHGDIIMVGAYAMLFIVTWLGKEFLWVAALGGVVVCALFGVVIERVAYKPLRNAPRISALITAIGVSFLLENGFQLLFSADYRPFPAVFPSTPLQLGSVRISMGTLVTIAIVLGLMVLLTLFVQNTRMGKAMRAVSEDMSAAQLMGINVNNTITLTFAIGSALAAVGSLLYCAAYPQVQPYMGSMLGLKAFIAAVLGGIGIMPGAMLGGFIMGIAESLTKGYVSTQLADAVVFGILIVVLLVKPSGIMGKTLSEKV